MSDKAKQAYRCKKRRMIAVVCAALTLGLCGCGGNYPALSEEQEQDVVKYAATLLYGNDQNHATRLMTEEEMIVAMRRQAAHAYKPEPKAEEDAGENSSGDDIQDDLIGDGTVQDTRTLAEFFGFEGIDISYRGCFFTKSYPESSGEDIFFAMDATGGNDLMILQFDITNYNAETTQVDILSLRPKFRAFINDGGQINAMSTLLLDDLKTTNRAIEPGESYPAVIVFEVTEEEAASMQQLDLTVKTDGDSWSARLQDASGETASVQDGPETTADGQRIGTLHFDLPEGFADYGDGMYYHKDDPYGSANINVLAQQEDTVTFQYTKEEFCQAVQYLYESVYGYDVQIQCTEFTKSELDGCRTLLARISYALEGVEIEQIQFVVETAQNITTVVTYTQQAGSGWTDAFNESIASMSIVYE